MVRQTPLLSMWLHQCLVLAKRVLERGLLEGGLHADPAWHENSFQMGTTPPTQCSESTHGELSATFHRIMRVTQRSVRKSLVQLSASFRQVAACFCSTVFRDFRLSAQFPQDFPQSFPQSFRRTFRIKFRRTFQVSAGLSGRFPHRWVQRIAAKVLENPVLTVPLAGPQGRRVLRGPSTLQKLVRQTVCEQMLTNRATNNFL